MNLHLNSPVLLWLVAVLCTAHSQQQQPQLQSQFIPQSAPHPVGPIPQASIPVSAVISTQGAQSRDAPVYQGQGQGSVSDYSAAYTQTAQGAAPPSLTTDPANPNGYYYYYYPVAQEKEPYSAPATYHTTDTYGIDPWGVIAVLAVVGLLIAGLAFIFPGWAWVSSHQDVYYRAFKAAPEYLGLDAADLTHLTANVITAIEGKSCMEQFVCNSGRVMKKMKKADSFLRFLEYFLPTSYVSNIKILRTAIKKPEECNKISCGRRRQ